MSRWHNVPVSTNVGLRRVKPEEMPTLIGLSISLDKKIAEILQTENPARRCYFVFEKPAAYLIQDILWLIEKLF